MAKNRKNQSAAIRFGPALRALGLCLLIAGAAVGYVWQKNQIDQLGRQIKQRETRLLELRDQNKKLRDQMAMLQSPARLQQKILELNLGLVPPSPREVWRLAEPVGQPVGETDRAPLRQLAAR
jgi:cell division protein FtsB